MFGVRCTPKNMDGSGKPYAASAGRPQSIIKKYSYETDNEKTPEAPR